MRLTRQPEHEGYPGHSAVALFFLGRNLRVNRTFYDDLAERVSLVELLVELGALSADQTIREECSGKTNPDGIGYLTPFRLFFRLSHYLNTQTVE